MAHLSWELPSSSAFSSQVRLAVNVAVMRRGCHTNVGVVGIIAFKIIIDIGSSG